LLDAGTLIDAPPIFIMTESPAGTYTFTVSSTSPGDAGTYNLWLNTYIFSSTHPSSTSTNTFTVQITDYCSTAVIATVPINDYVYIINSGL
jgi:subtilisin-like proprotein convertase family protein